MSFIKNIWRSISLIGIDDSPSNRYSSERKLGIFFNRSIFIGGLGLIGQIFVSYRFVREYTFFNLLGVFAIISAFYLHSKGRFGWAKRIVIYTIFGVGILLTILSSADSLYHIGVLTVLVFAWVLFDPKTEYLELFLCAALTLLIYIIGEFELFNSNSFTEPTDSLMNRMVGIVTSSAMVMVFIYFLRSTNVTYEKELSEALEDREKQLSEVTSESEELQYKREILEKAVVERTSEILSQKVLLEKQNAEKEVLLKEIHHRVKNNLQIIVSLLNLQTSRMESEDAITAMRETSNRIISMSLVHQRMYQTTSFVAIEFKSYIDLLLETNYELFSESHNTVSYKNTTPSDVKINIETAIPLGLIINEMITNSYKYAFLESNKAHKLHLAVSSLNESEYLLYFKDNGPGLPENLNIEEAESLGLELITALAEQINGTLKTYNENGAVFEIRFSA